jgi:hypothetical protein
MGKFDIWGKEQIPAFFAIRPMSSPQFVLVKMAGAALGSLFSWGWFVILFLTWAAIEASSLNPSRSIVRDALAQATLRDFSIFGLALIALLAMSCRDLVIGMWITLLGRKWLAIAIGFAIMPLFGLAGFAGQWLYRHREYLPTLLTYLPWLLAVLLFVKLALTAWIIRGLQHRDLASRETIRDAIAVWGTACTVLVAIVYCFVPVTPTIALGAVLSVPLARIAAAPLALHFNRHR